MSLNQPNPPKQPSLLHRAKQTVSAATIKVTTTTRQAIKQKSHKVLPTKLANLALGPDRRADEYSPPPAPAYPRHRSPSPDGMGIVEAEIESASEASGDDGGDGGGDGDRSASSWEEAVVPPGAVAEERVQPRERGERERARVRFAGDDDGMESDGVVVYSSGSQLGSASPSPPRDARDITERERRLMRAQHRAEKRRGVAAAGRGRGRGRARGVVQARDDRSSSEEEEGHMSKDSDDFPRGSEQMSTPYSLSWRHGIGRTMVAVPCGSRGELERTYQGARRVAEAHEPHPRELLEELGARQYRPVGVVRGPRSVGGDLSRFRIMGRYFKSGSVGSGEGAGS